MIKLILALALFSTFMTSPAWSDSCLQIYQTGNQDLSQAKQKIDIEIRKRKRVMFNAADALANNSNLSFLTISEFFTGEARRHVEMISKNLESFESEYSAVPTVDLAERKNKVMDELKGQLEKNKSFWKPSFFRSRKGADFDLEFRTLIQIQKERDVFMAAIEKLQTKIQDHRKYLEMALYRLEKEQDLVRALINVAQKNGWLLKGRADLAFMFESLMNAEQILSSQRFAIGARLETDKLRLSTLDLQKLVIDSIDFTDLNHLIAEHLENKMIKEALASNSIRVRNGMIESLKEIDIEKAISSEELDLFQDFLNPKEELLRYGLNVTYLLSRSQFKILSREKDHIKAMTSEHPSIYGFNDKPLIVNRDIDPDFVAVMARQKDRSYRGLITGEKYVYSYVTVFNGVTQSHREIGKFSGVTLSGKLVFLPQGQNQNFRIIDYKTVDRTVVILSRGYK